MHLLFEKTEILEKQIIQGILKCYIGHARRSGNQKRKSRFNTIYCGIHKQYTWNEKKTVACTVAIASAVYLWRQTELDLFYCF